MKRCIYINIYKHLSIYIYLFEIVSSHSQNKQHWNLPTLRVRACGPCSFLQIFKCSFLAFFLSSFLPFFLSFLLPSEPLPSPPPLGHQLENRFRNWTSSEPTFFYTNVRIDFDIILANFWPPKASKVDPKRTKWSENLENNDSSVRPQTSDFIWIESRTVENYLRRAR